MNNFGYCLPTKAIDRLTGSSLSITTLLQQFQSQQQPELLSMNSDSDGLRKTIQIPLLSGYSLGDEVNREKPKELLKTAEIREKNMLLSGSDLPGFMPLREDFDLEYDNEAELLLADMEINGPLTPPTEEDITAAAINSNGLSLLYLY